jgi:hypothetical protein
VENVLAFLRSLPEAVCGSCISSTLAEQATHLMDVLTSLEKDGRVLFAMASCHLCGEIAPSYRPA